MARKKKTAKKMTCDQWIESAGMSPELDFNTDDQPRKLLKPVKDKERTMTAAQWKKEMKVGTKTQRKNLLINGYVSQPGN